MINSISEKHLEIYQQKPLIVRSPGRINLMGGHTDYNKGFALPAAIDKALYLSFSQNGNKQQIVAHSLNFQEGFSFNLDNFPEKQQGWQGYLVSMVQELQERNFPVTGFSCLINGNIPIGAGLSSSAAFCCGLIYGISNIFNFNISKKEIALIAQATEHRIGLNCGLLDQFAIVFSQKNKGLFVDFKNLEIEDCPMELSNETFVLFDSKVKHELASESGYNDRVSSCQKVVNILQKENPSIQSLRDVSAELLRSQQSVIDPIDFKRANYIIGENERVKAAKIALENNDVATLGTLMTQTHKGLQHEYQVTTPELDYLITLATAHPNIYGGRMIGGGFGGCTLNLVKQENIEQTIATIQAQYKEKFGIDIPAYQVSPSEGISVVQRP